MTSPNEKGYDEQLLAHAPEVTKADLQGGYNPDILNAPRAPSSRVRSPDPEVDQRDIESSGSASPPKYQPARPKSFWKTRKGIIVITSLVILVAVILGAVLGGVLGSQNHGHKTETSSPTGSNGGDSQGSGKGGSGNGAPEGSLPPSSPATTTTTAASATNSPNGTTGIDGGSSGTSNSNGSQNGGTHPA